MNPKPPPKPSRSSPPKISRLKPVEGLEFLPGPHRYRYKDPVTQKWTYAKASVTTVCSNKTPEQLQIIESTRHKWEPRGNTIHHVAELFLNHQDYQSSIGDYADWITPLISHPVWDSFEAVATEHRMFDHRYGIAGSCDCILQHKKTHELVLADFKSQSSKESRPYDISAQLGGYLVLADQCHRPPLIIDRCFGIWVRPGLTEITSYKAQDCRDAFDAARHYWLQKQPNW